MKKIILRCQNRLFKETKKQNGKANVQWMCLSNFELILLCSKSWMDGSPVVLQRWDENQPSFQRNDENCAAMTQFMGEYLKRTNLQLIQLLNKEPI